MFEARTPDGWVWSNRPLAAVIFGDLPLAPDERGWAHSAVADEYFGDATPFDGVRAVGPATHVEWDGRTGRRTVTAIDTVATTMSVSPPSDGGTVDRVPAEVAEEVAADLLATVRTISTFYDNPPIVDLTGGRDSRLVAAAFIAADVPFRLHTHDGVPADLAVARDLLSRLPRPYAHDVDHVAGGGRTVAVPPLAVLPNAVRWHDYAEALRPCTYLPSSAPRGIDGNLRLVIGGVGGEAAHGFYYPRDLPSVLARPPRERMRLLARRVVTRLSPVPGPSDEARALVTDHVERVLLRIHDLGVSGGSVLDHYYIQERMRRWGTTSERIGTVSPLLSLTFLRAALSLDPAQRRANTLHREVTRWLVPQWGDVPYFPAEYPADADRTRALAPPPRLFRVGSAADADQVEALLADAEAWAQWFDRDRIVAHWWASVGEVSTLDQERLLRSVVWRGMFGDWIAAATGSPLPHRSGRLPPARPSAGRPAGLLGSARRSRLARRAARTRVWARLRDRPLISRMRSRAG